MRVVRQYLRVIYDLGRRMELQTQLQYYLDLPCSMGTIGIAAYTTLLDLSAPKDTRLRMVGHRVLQLNRSILSPEFVITYAADQWST